jgi:hypothetical protein
MAPLSLSPAHRLSFSRRRRLWLHRLRWFAALAPALSSLRCSLIAKAQIWFQSNSELRLSAGLFLLTVPANTKQLDALANSKFEATLGNL